MGGCAGTARPAWGGTQILSTALSGLGGPERRGRWRRRSEPPRVLAVACFAGQPLQIASCVFRLQIPALAFSYLLLRTKTQKVARPPPLSPSPRRSSPTGPVLAFQQTFQDTRFQRASPDTPGPVSLRGLSLPPRPPPRSGSPRPPHWGPPLACLLLGVPAGRLSQSGACPTPKLRPPGAASQVSESLSVGNPTSPSR